MAERYVLRLYVCGASAASVRARSAVERLCRKWLDGHHALEIVDVLRSPERAEDDRVLATPTLIRLAPAPPRRIVGDLSNLPALLLGLDLDAEDAPMTPTHGE